MEDESGTYRRYPVSISLPLVHAVLNGLTFLFFDTCVYRYQRQKYRCIELFMLIALALSAIFLVSYVIYHITHPTPDSWEKEHSIRILLYTHLSHYIKYTVIPLALLSIHRGWTNDIEK